jgi:hypothetical protein
MSIDHQHDDPGTDVRDSNPSGAGPGGLEGDLGISSERPGPEGANPAGRGIEGTGSHGSAPQGTDGTFETARAAAPSATEVPREHPQEPAEGDDPGAAQPSGPERTSTEDPAEGPDDPEKDGENRSRATGIDRTVGEDNSAQVRKHPFDPSKNPGHG